MAPGVDDQPSPENIAVPVPSTTSTPSMVSGLPARPMAAMRPARMPMRLADAEHRVEHQRVEDHGVARPRATAAHREPVARRLAEARQHLVAALRVVALDSITSDVSPRRTRSPVVGP